MFVGEPSFAKRITHVSDFALVTALRARLSTPDHLCAEL